METDRKLTVEDLIEAYRERILEGAREYSAHEPTCPNAITYEQCTCQRARLLRHLANIPLLHNAQRARFRELLIELAEKHLW